MVGTGPHAVYVRLPPGSGVSALGLLHADATRLPLGCVLPVGVPVPQLAPGDRVTVGASAVHCGTQVWHVSRWWQPTAVEPGAVANPDPLSVALFTAMRADRAVPLPAPVAARLTEGGADPAMLAGLLGQGRGLTPSGDDALAGLLLGMRAVLPLDGQHTVDRVGSDLARSAAERTTALSAGLLALAARGVAARCVVDAIHALAHPPGQAVRSAFTALLGLGHGSGSDLAAGLLAAVREDVGT